MMHRDHHAVGLATHTPYTVRCLLVWDGLDVREDLRITVCLVEAIGDCILVIPSLSSN